MNSNLGAELDIDSETPPSSWLSRHEIDEANPQQLAPGAEDHADVDNEIGCREIPPLKNQKLLCNRGSTIFLLTLLPWEIEAPESAVRVALERRKKVGFVGPDQKDR